MEMEGRAMIPGFKAALMAVSLIVAGVLTTSCGLEKSRIKEEIRIGVAVYDEYDTYISVLMDNFMDCVAEQSKNGNRRLSVLKYASQSSQITQNDQVEEMISKGCDVICVNLVDRTEPSMIIDMAREADIPVIFFNRELVGEDLMRWDRLYYVGADAFESGTMQGELAAQGLEEKDGTDRNADGIIQYVVLEGEAGHQDSIVRSEYSVNAILDAGFKVEKLESSIANWNRAQAQTKTAQLIDKYGDSIELILANNDDMALGAIDEYASRETDREDYPVIVGIDGLDAGLEAVKEGTMAGTVYNDKEGQAYSMLRLCIASVTGEFPEDLNLVDGKYIRLPYEKITKKNVNDFLLPDTDAS